MTYSGPVRRLVAFVIDILMIIASYVVLGFFLGLNIIFIPLAGLPMLGLWFYGGMFAFSWFYFVFQESSSWQATIGKRLMGIKVVDLKGRPISFWRATGRYFTKLFLRPIFMIGLSMIVFTKKKQALHDKMAGTLVIHNFFE